MHQIKSSVLFIIFNRPDCTNKVFRAIREGKPRKLYISADGPRDNYPNDFDLCKRTREMLNIDWDCEVKTLFHEKNLGCKKAVSKGIKWFFENEEEGIVLEDDCLPSERFFEFCDLLLERYRYDNRIVHISGAKMHIDRIFGEATYYFSKHTHIWGWASWRRVWKQYDENLTLLEDFKNQDIFKYIYENTKVVEVLANLFQKTKDNVIDTWDYQYAFLNFWNNGLCICPNHNLISNLGFDENATHTVNPKDVLSNLPHEPFGDISHPKFFVPHLNADYQLLEQNIPSSLQKKIAQTKSGIKKFLKIFN
jgi:hypothetical protein